MKTHVYKKSGSTSLLLMQFRLGPEEMQCSATKAIEDRERKRRQAAAWLLDPPS